VSIQLERRNTGLIAGPSIDRYRAALKGTWKDEAGPACGQTYDLGSHLIDQALLLFGRPKSITAFIENTRNIGDPDVDDGVRLSL
jgi:predicted dehydrogenase